MRKAFQAVFSSATFTSRNRSRNFQSDNLADTHHHVPAYHRGPFGRECFPEPLLVLQFLNLCQILRLIVLEKNREQNGLRELQADF